MKVSRVLMPPFEPRLDGRAAPVLRLLLLLYGPPSIVFCSIFEAVPCNASAYWSRMFVCMRHASLCSFIAADIA